MPDNVGWENWSPSSTSSSGDDWAGDPADNTTSDYLTDNYYVEEDDLRDAADDAASGDFGSVTDYVDYEDNQDDPSYGDGDPSDPADSSPTTPGNQPPAGVDVGVGSLSGMAVGLVAGLVGLIAVFATGGSNSGGS